MSMLGPRAPSAWLSQPRTVNVINSQGLRKHVESQLTQLVIYKPQVQTARRGPLGAWAGLHPTLVMGLPWG